MHGFVLPTVFPILAHGFGGANGLPLPRWLLAYGVGVGVVLGFIVLRVALPRPPVAVVRPARSVPARVLVVTRSIGLVLFIAVVVAAAFGTNDPGSNIAPVSVIVLFWLGFQVVSAVGGDGFWLLNPFDTIALAVARSPEPERSSPDPHWTAAAMLFAFVWFVFAYPEFYPPSPRNIAWFLALYTVAVAIAATLWGRSWVREGEGFSALFGLLGRRREREPSAGTVALLCVYLGAIGFDAISQTDWWVSVLGTSRGWSERLLNTVGLAWIVVSVAIVYLAATRVAALLTHREPDEMAVRFAPVLVPLGLAWSVAHYLRAFLADLQSFIALVSDPLGRGWDLFGTIDNPVNYRWLTAGQAGWIETLVLLAGCLLSAYEVHRTAITVVRGPAAVRAIHPIEAALVLAAVGAVALLLGT